MRKNAKKQTFTITDQYSIKKWVSRSLLVPFLCEEHHDIKKIHLPLQKDAEKYTKINLVTSPIRRILHKEAWEGRTLSTHRRVEMCIEIRISQGKKNYNMRR